MKVDPGEKTSALGAVLHRAGAPHPPDRPLLTRWAQHTSPTSTGPGAPLLLPSGSPGNTDERPDAQKEHVPPRVWENWGLFATAKLCRPLVRRSVRGNVGAGKSCPSSIEVSRSWLPRPAL